MYFIFFQHRNTLQFWVSFFCNKAAGFSIPSAATGLICIFLGLLFKLIICESLYALVYIYLENSCFLWGESTSGGSSSSSQPGSSLPQHSPDPDPDHTPKGDEGDYLSPATLSGNNGTKEDYQDEEIRAYSDQIRHGNNEERIRGLERINNLARHEVRPDRIDGVIDRLSHLADYKGMPEFCRKDIRELISKCYSMRRPGK